MNGCYKRLGACLLRSTSSIFNSVWESKLCFQAVSRLKRLKTGLSRWSPGFNPRTVHVRFVVGEVSAGQVFSSSISFCTVLCDSTSASWYQETNRRNLGTFQKRNTHSKRRSFIQQENFYLIWCWFPRIYAYCCVQLMQHSKL